MNGVGRTAVVVMGVAGSGKTTVGQLLAARLGWAFAEADDFHSAANVAKMSAGVPLGDADRSPWLDKIRSWVDAGSGSAVLTCSALRRSYRDVLSGAEARVRFVHLHGTADDLGRRLAARVGHFMPTSLLDSQLATLEPLDPDEDGVLVGIAGTPDQIVDEIVLALALS